ncbi:pupal cuticle protein Edg-84A-like [Centruroides vittatus]|uniref:pupal cuticle protein Edg-84A-like n=1 Tax=Centruroides vittatus TaxID=120091 RepID=UPI00350F9CAA
MKIAILFCIFAFVSAGDIVSPGAVSDSQQSQDDTGSYSFGYNIVDEFGTKGRTESGDEYGNKKGSYYLSDADGRTRRVDYVADELGFRASVNTNEPGTMDSAPASVAYYAEGAPNVVIKTPAKVVAPAYAAAPAKVIAPAYAAAPAKIITPAAPAKIIAPTYSEIPAPRYVTRLHAAPAYATHFEPAPLLSHTKVVAPAYAVAPPPPPPPPRYVAHAAPLLTPAKVVAPALHAPLLSTTKVVAPTYHHAPLLSTTKVVAPTYHHAPYGRVFHHHAPLLSPAKVIAPTYTHTKVVAPAAPLLTAAKVVAPVPTTYSTSSKTVVHHPAPLVKYHTF